MNNWLVIDEQSPYYGQALPYVAPGGIGGTEGVILSTGNGHSSYFQRDQVEKIKSEGETPAEQNDRYNDELYGHGHW